MDFDIEMEDAAGQYPNEVRQNTPLQEDILAVDVDDVQEPGEIGEDDESNEVKEADIADKTLVPSKVHIRGLDALNPDDIKAYVSEHVGSSGGRDGPFDRIEWIDDTSANLVFSSDTAAAAALSALSAIPIDDPAQLPLNELLPAKIYSARPDDVSAGLAVRLAVASDKKQVGAASRSRFYLLHPEYDPEERKRNHQQIRRRDDRNYQGRDYRPKHRSYRDNRRDDRQDDRDDDIRNNSFDVNLYDDGPVLANRSSRRRSWSRSSRPRSWSRSRSRSRSRTRQNNRDKELFPVSNTKDKELFPEKSGARQDESTVRRSDRDQGRGRDNGRLRNRSASPRRDDDFYYDEGGDYDGRLADERAEAAAAAASRNRDKARAIKGRLSTAKGDGSNDNGSRELFPSETGSTAQMDLFDSTSAVAAQLSDRITRTSGNGQLDSSSTFNIRGLAGQQGRRRQGISIKGAASARELFPGKLSGMSNGNGSSQGRNADKELLDNSLASRVQPRPRQRAEDLFH